MSLYDVWRAAGRQDCVNAIDLDEIEERTEDVLERGRDARLLACLANPSDAGLRHAQRIAVTELLLEGRAVWMSQHALDVYADGLEPAKAWKAWQSSWTECALDLLRTQTRFP